MATYVTGSYDYNAICDGCGRKMKASQLRKRWDGLMMCREDWEPRHPMDFYKTRNDSHKLPWTRPDSNGEDIGPPLNPETITTTPLPGQSGLD